MADRITTLAAAATHDHPTWLTSIGASCRRSEAIRETVCYRAVYGVVGDDPLGPEPDRAGRQHEAWSAARRAISGSQNTRRQENASGATRLMAALDREPASPTDDLTSPTCAATSRHY